MRFASYAVLALMMVASLSLEGCGPSTRLRTSPRTEEVREVAASPPPEEIALPKPRPKGERSLEETLAQRRSVRSFTEEELSLEDISQLLWAAQGTTSAWGGRTAPSAGALYPLEIYVATANGLHHYVPQGHKVIIESQDDLRLKIWEAGLKQDAIREAPAVFVITAVYERTEKKYGDRAERYVKLEAGHACQNILLQAVALDLGAVPIGAFYDDQVQAALSLPPNHEPLYLIPVGRPRE